MEFESYNEIIFCSSPEMGCVLLNEKSFSNQIIGIAIRSKANVDELTLQKQIVLHADAARFCLFLDASFIRNEIQVLEHVVILLYHPKYLFRNEKAIIYLVNDTTAKEGTYSKIAGFVNELGFDIEIQHLPSWDEPENSKDEQIFQFASVSEPGELSALYKQKLLSNAFVDKTIIVHSKDRTHALDTLKAIEASEEEFRIHNSYLHSLFQQYRRLSKQASMLGVANKQLEIDLRNQEKYLAVLRNEKEMEKIVEFYHREYEVLPLWYKRFGHIIKFITGKRKLRSKQKQE